MIAAIVPAAGQSRRMGAPKLTLPLADGRSVIEHVVQALRNGGTELIVVVGPPIEAPGASELLRQAAGAQAQTVACPEPSPDMRSTVLRGLDVLEADAQTFEGLLITPGDSVGLTESLVSTVIERFRSDPEKLVVPVHNGRRGHPMALPWPLAQNIRTLPENVGINALRDQYADRIVWLNVQEPGTTADLDTPDDYQRWAH